jgi:hypothetical protein
MTNKPLEFTLSESESQKVRFLSRSWRLSYIRTIRKIIRDFKVVEKPRRKNK